MPQTNFPAGVSAFGVPLFGSLAAASSTNILWVDSNAANPNAGTFDQPYSTIVRALAACVAGDTIFVKEKHVESVIAAAGITVSKAGVKIIGLGETGRRPVITLGTSTAATVLVSGAGVLIENIGFVGNLSNIVTCFDVTGINCTLRNLHFGNAGANLDFLRCIKASGAANTADGLQVLNCRWLTIDADDLEFISLVNNVDRLIVDGNFVVTKGTASPLVLSATTKIITAARITNNFLQNANTAGNLFISNDAATNSGLVAYNLLGNLDVTGAQTFGAAGGLQFFENYSTSTSTESGALSQAADTPLS